MSSPNLNYQRSKSSLGGDQVLDSSSTVDRSPWTDVPFGSQDQLSTTYDFPTSPRRSIDVFNENARQKVHSLSKPSPSLYDARAIGNRGRSSNASRPRQTTLSIELRRRSDDSFVSATNDNDPLSPDVDSEAAARSTFDIGRWTVRDSQHELVRSPRPSATTPRRGPVANHADEDGEHDESLYRITSEPVRGGKAITLPFGNALNFGGNSNDGHVSSLAEMRETVQKIGTLLDERRQEGVSVARKKDGQFWLAFSSIAVCGFLSATDMTIISPILPTIAADLPSSEISATWITSAFLLTMTAFQPLWGGISDAIGRKYSLMSALVIFTIGSIPCTVAQSMLTMVIGRGVQGIGGGGMLAVGEVLLSDLTTLAERGYFLGLLSMAFAVAAIAAPIIGGVFATIGGLGWRWAFIINFPIGLMAFLLVALIKGLQTPKLTVREKIEHCDAPSALLLFASVLALLIGLTRGGEQYAWADGRVIAPLVCGAMGLIVFFAIQWWPSTRNYISPRPILDRTLFFGKGRRTSTIAYALTFLHGMLLYGAVQNLILYFEARDATPLRAAVNVLPANVPSTPAAFVAGVLMAVTARYKALIVASQALMLVGLGMLVYLDNTSPTSQWAIFQVIASLGIGAMYTLALPPIQASVPTSHLARATATFAFVRSLGAVWGVSATLIAYSAQSGQRLQEVPGATQAGYSGATAVGITTQVKFIADPVLRQGVRLALLSSIRVAFAVLVPFAFVGLVLSLFIQHIPLPNFNDSGYAFQEEERRIVGSSSNDVEKNSASQRSGSDVRISLSSRQIDEHAPFGTHLRRSGSFWH